MPEGRICQDGGHAEPVPAPARYLLEEQIGRGGMGAVYRVRDRESGERLALKRLLLPPADAGASAERRKQISALFEREYHTLAQLAHPRVIRVFDYGVDDHGPYYTMELLEGSDLTQLAPLPWKQACRIVRDVASCLAILHSRRLLHRDVSPRNVRCTPDGRAKLIDFGAMAPMGVAEEIVGTPPCLPPEVLYKQPLDPRSDLFSLGAVLYFALTARHAYPARALPELPALWKQRPAAPSAKGEGIPENLDPLVLALLHPDAPARPLTAAEVIDRLESIAELPPSDTVAVAQAYLVTPTLVAREPTLETFRSLLRRLGDRQGSVLFVEAEAGLGRSRLLDAFALEAKLAGVAVLRAGATHAAAGEFGMARAWVDELLRAPPRSALEAAEPYAGTLGHVFPALHERLGRPELEPFASPAERTLRVQDDLLAWLQAVADHHCVVLLADDLHQADPASAALLAGLVPKATSSRLLVVATAEAGAVSAVGEARRLVREAGTLLTLSPLCGDETEPLLRSVFGDVPRLELLTDWMQRQSGGNPRLCMELAAYLLEQGDVRYESGAWVLPQDPEGLEVPTAHEQMLARRLSKLSPDARALAEMRALVSPIAPLEADEYALLLEGEDAVARSHAALSELGAAEVLVPVEGGYLFRQPGFLQVLEAELSDEERRARHRSLARVYDKRPVPPQITAHHWVQAGEEGRALDWLLAQPEVDPNSARDRNPYVARALEATLAEAKRQGRPPREQIRLLSRLVACASQVDSELARYAGELTEHLERDTGLAFWHALDPAMDPAERTEAALAQAQVQYERTPEGERGLSPREATATLMSAARMVASACGRSRDVPGCRANVALFEPFASLSPAAAFTYELLVSNERRLSGQDTEGQFRELEQRILEGVPGMDANQLRHTYLILAYYSATAAYYESLSDWVLGVADELERTPMFEAMAWQVRLQYHLTRGNALEIATCRKRRDLARVQSPVTSQHAASGLQLELEMAGRYNDLLQLKSLLELLDAEAAVFPGWRPIAHQAHGEYHFARSDWDAARRELEAALALSAAGEFARWPDIMARCLQTMVYQGEAEAACARGRDALRDAERTELNWLNCVSLRLAVGLAEVAAGRRDAGLARIGELRRECEERGVLDLYAGSSETLARAALYADDAALFAEAMEQLAELVRPGQHPALLAKYERLAEEGRRRFGGDDERTAEEDRADTEAVSRVSESLRIAANRRERVARALALLQEETDARGGFLFGMRDGALVCLGSHDDSAPSAAMEHAVRSYLVESGSAMEMTVTVLGSAELERSEWMVDGRLYRPAPLACQWKEEQCFAGVAVLEADAEGDALPSPALLTALAEHLAGAGDVTPLSWLEL